MALNIRAPETHQLARELAEQTGETMTKAVWTALRERRDRLQEKKEEEVKKRAQAILDFAARYRASLRPDAPSIDEILSYDENGLPT